MIYFFYCDLYNQDVQEHVDRNVRKKLDEYSSRENLKGINAVASYTGKIFVLNLMNPHHKVIIQEHRVDIKGTEVVVYFVREIINMGQNFNWLQNYVAIRDGKWLEYNPLPASEIESFKAQYSETVVAQAQKEQPPEKLTNWHHDYRLRVDYDIYETEDWVKFAMSNGEADGMKDDEAKLFRLVLVEILTGKNNPAVKYSIIKSGLHFEIKSAELNDVSIFYSVIWFEQIAKPIYLLHNGANVNTQEQHFNYIQKSLNDIEFKFDSIENVQRLALRAYPHWALNNADLWKAIQKNSETGNLSLLPEQTIFLKEFTFPKYINGQAGSGKSTMLYYLFANAYFYKCFDEIKGDIIFLTENEDLLKYTKKSIVELLQCNPEFELTLEDISNVDKHFISFKNFLLSQIPPDNDDFPVDKYLGFSKFKVLYETSTIATHIKNRYSAELIWFAVSTYIYGFDLDYQITSLNYDQMMPAEGRQLLSLQDLQGIEKEVLPYYKKLIDEMGYWDKTKIIRFLKNNGTNQNLYDVIFCDEAQDFSRVELRYILGLSTYLQYDLSNTTQVPIVFAGDALQTVNPTGFRTAEVKDMLYRELKEIAGFNLDTNKIEYAPGFNYRSSQPIVNVANAIQYWRKKNYSADIKKPQIAKRPEFGKDSHLNIFLDYGTVETNHNDILKKLEYKIFIIPVNSDEKDDYILKNPILKSFDNINIKTSVEAKGIDYEQVVLYGFGEYGSNLNSDEEYENRFFYNKLYVAVTRAQYELIIVDSTASEANFWKPLINFYADSSWSVESEVEDVEIRETIVFGAQQISNVIQSTPEMAFENAEKDKRQGIFDKNPYLLRVAANQFIRLGNKAEHYICLALMYKFLGQWEDAAKYFLRKEVGNDGISEAANIYWEGKLLTQFISFTANVRSDNHLIKLLIANLIQNNILKFSDIRYLHEQRSELRKILNETSWKDEILKALIELLDKSVDDETIKLLIDVFEEICSSSNKDIWCKIGEKNFSIQRFEYAIKAFEKCGEDGILYIKSKIEVSNKRNDYPELIFWLGRLVKEANEPLIKQSHRKEIIELFKNHKAEILGERKLPFAYLYIFEALLYEGKKQDLLLEIAYAVEVLFSSNLLLSELVDFYNDQLLGGGLNSNSFQFILNRWAKHYYTLKGDINLLNESYRKISTNNKVRFQVYTEPELLNLSPFPVRIQKSPPVHLQTITIKNFRGFEYVRLENLSLFNLVVGDNNIGKTSFLEALLFTDEKREFLHRLAFAYIERRNLFPVRSINSEEAKFVYNVDNSFIGDYKNYRDLNSNIEYTIEQNRDFWEFTISTDSNFPVILDDKNFIHFTEEDYKSLTDLSLSDSIKSPLIPYGKGFGIDLAKAYFDEVGTKPKIEQEFLLNMKLFIPTVDRVIADTATGTIEILDRDFPDNFRPLHQYGEGANKLFRILVSLALHKGKRILIDEIDAGIHYSRFKFFWKIVLEIAKKDGTQIVATTHNEECIKYFNDVIEELGVEFQSVSRVVQLKLVAGNIKIRSYEFDSFNSAIEDNLELRGGKVI